MNWKLVLPYALAFVLGALLFHSKHVQPIPQIITHYDTVRVIDTAWVTRLKHDTVYSTNIVERVITQKPETVLIHSFAKADGVKAIGVGEHVGDTTKVLVEHDVLHADTLVQWGTMYAYWTRGPLASVVLNNGTPAIRFYEPPKACTPLKNYAIGAGGITLLRILLGK